METLFSRAGPQQPQLRRCRCSGGGGGGPAPALAPPCRLARRMRAAPVAVLGTQSELSEDEERAREARAAVTKRIKALGEQRRLKEAVQELAGLSKIGVQPDARAATALVAACARAGNMEMAESVFDSLFGDFLRPDEVAFAVLLRGYGARRPPAWGDMDATLTRMRARFGLEPTAVSYNALLDVCVASDDADRALDVIDRMADDGVEPNEYTVAAVARKRSLRSYLRKRLG
ncbi:hypothetical protein Rsub_05920 [Raphidocelis subcapitata]|uniref:Pentacotripeptide-repeat region of PRORP domain-containing protein n=1 Tax=Raphidocelis subcapitata TaxID=307507 RepID=A0A2V0NZY4_9CHLO|nr:hypothetical protein Rsub_05920 [Raphidocelis subcapitata]|eukprot:GBF93188.1 hypothetical protein Rsub_05920 [Raphidocelis subcapitata]